LARQKSAKRKMTNAEKTEAKWGLAFVAPTIIGLLVLNFFPIIKTIYLSFFKTGDFGKGNIFVGLQNYSAVLTSSEFWRSLWNTFKYALIEVPFSIVIAMILAVFLNRKIKFRSGYRTIFFLPMVAAPAAVAMVWKWLYNQQYGLLNQIIGKNISWITNPKFAWIAVGIVGVWSIIGYNMVLFLGGLQEIPHDYYEAAEIDGASGVKQFFNITVPLVSPTTFFIVQTRIIAALQVFDLIYMMIDKTNVALKNTQSVVYVFYQYVFTQDNKGYGSTMIVLLLLVIMAITVVLQRAEKRFVFYN
jgi:multiple sugar transport system permease protein